MNKKKMGEWLIWISVLAAVVAGYVSISQSTVFGLAGTQWMMVAIILGIYGVYAKLNTTV